MRIGAMLAVWACLACALGQSPHAPEGSPDSDAPDESILRHLLYGSLSVEDLTEQQGEELTAAARRLFDHSQARLDHAKKLVDEGALPRLALTPYIEDLDRRRRTLDLAVSRASLLTELAGMARRELEALARADQAAPGPAPLAERFDGDGLLRAGDLKTISLAFQKRFSRRLPISAQGATAVHRALGFDHRGRFDVALDPDQPEGVWLRQYLHTMRIPYFAFRAQLAGRATGPHIHVGPPSDRIAPGG